MFRCEKEVTRLIQPARPAAFLASLIGNGAEHDVDRDLENLVATKLYVGNLPFQTTEDELREMFGRVGQVASVKIIIDRDSGRSKGFGFVEMASDDEAHQAVEQLNGASLNGRRLTVNEARPMQPGGGGGRGDRGEFRGNRFSR